MIKKNIPKRWGVFTPDEINEAIKNNRMLSIGFNTSPICTLKCRYCFNEKCNPKDTIDIETRKRIFREAKDLGIKEIVICGKGEPFEDPDIDATIEYIFKLGLRLEIFTNGIYLTDRHIGMIRDNDSCITIKYLANNPVVQDYLAGMDGYHGILSAKVGRLKTAGFQEGQISISTQITTMNIEEMPEIHKMCRDNGFIPHFARLLEKGRALEYPELFCTPEQIQRLVARLQRTDETLGYDCTNYNPIFGHHKCRFIYFSPYVEFDGNVYPCIGRTRLAGSLKEMSFAEIWDGINAVFKDMPQKMQGYCAGCKSLLNYSCYGCIKENMNNTGSEFSSVDRGCPSCFTGRGE